MDERTQPRQSAVLFLSLTGSPSVWAGAETDHPHFLPLLGANGTD